MTPHGGNGMTYRLSASSLVRQALRELLIRASAAGIDADVIRAVKIIRERLTHDPLGFGEPLYQLPTGKLEVRLGAVPPLSVRYAVHQEQPLVFLLAVTPLSGSGL
jgi:hypothetical protein